MTGSSGPSDSVTVDQVLELFIGAKRHWAEKLIRYADLRANGVYQADARREIGFKSEGTLHRYERATVLLREHLGLPPLPTHVEYGDPSPNDKFRRASFSGGHSRWHVGRGKFDPNCALCQQDRRAKERNPSDHLPREPDQPPAGAGSVRNQKP